MLKFVDICLCRCQSKVNWGVCHDIAGDEVASSARDCGECRTVMEEDDLISTAIV